MALRLHRSGGLEVLEQLDVGKPPYVAPTYRVRCPECRRAYPTKAWLRDIVIRVRCRRCHDARRAQRRKPDAGKSRPFDMTSAARFVERHGERVAYVAGCRCGACREANNAYARLRGKLNRAGDTNRVIEARRVRRHILRLSAAGVGTWTVADIAGVSRASLQAIRSGTKTKLREQTEKRILAVTRDALSDGKLVDARGTRKLIARLMGAGFTKSAIALRLGMTRPALQFRGDRITARTRARVERLVREVDP